MGSLLTPCPNSVLLACMEDVLLLLHGRAEFAARLPVLDDSAEFAALLMLWWLLTALLRCVEWMNGLLNGHVDVDWRGVDVVAVSYCDALGVQYEKENLRIGVCGPLVAVAGV